MLHNARCSLHLGSACGMHVRARHGCTAFRHGNHTWNFWSPYHSLLPRTVNHIAACSLLLHAVCNLFAHNCFSLRATLGGQYLHRFWQIALHDMPPGTRIVCYRAFNMLVTRVPVFSKEWNFVMISFDISSILGGILTNAMSLHLAFKGTTGALFTRMCS